RNSMFSRPPVAEMVSARNALPAGYIACAGPGPAVAGSHARMQASFHPYRFQRMTAIKVPPLGESIVEATISRWLKQEGEAVASGETLVELETDKITVEVPALKAGVLTRRMKQEGDVVAVDEVLGELEEGGAAAGGGAGAESGAG